MGNGALYLFFPQTAIRIFLGERAVPHGAPRAPCGTEVETREAVPQALQREKALLKRYAVNDVGKFLDLGPAYHVIHKGHEGLFFLVSGKGLGEHGLHGLPFRP